MHHIRLSKPNCIADVPGQLFTSPKGYGYINCGTRLLLAELDHLKQQIDIDRDAELITFYLLEETVMSWCMYIVSELNLTYPPTNWTQAKDLFSKIKWKFALNFYSWLLKKTTKNEQNQNNFVVHYFHNYFDEILAKEEALE